MEKVETFLTVKLRHRGCRKLIWTKKNHEKNRDKEEETRNTKSSGCESRYGLLPLPIDSSAVGRTFKALTKHLGFKRSYGRVIPKHLKVLVLRTNGLIRSRTTDGRLACFEIHRLNSERSDSAIRMNRIRSISIL